MTLGPRPIASTEDLTAVVLALMDAWCGRRYYRALRPILNGFPTGQWLTDDWHNLRDALRNVIAEAGQGLTDEERDAVDEGIVTIDRALRRHAENRPW